MGRAHVVPRFLFFISLLFAGQAFAGAAAVMTATAGAVSTASGVRAVTGSFTATAGSFNIPSVVNVAGRSVTMPAAARIAANAPSYVLSGIRSKNIWVAGGAIALWLGMEYLQQQGGSWVVPVPSCSYSGLGPMSCTLIAQAAWQQSGSHVSSSVISGLAGKFAGCTMSAPSFGGPSGPHYQSGSCTEPGLYWMRYVIGNATYNYNVMSTTSGSRLATDADFNAVLTHPMPDAVAVEAAAANVPVPVEEPSLKAGAVTSPISDPYTDPVTGKSVQDKVQVIPDPVPGNPMQVRVQPFTAETQPDGSVQNKAAELPTSSGGGSGGNGTPTPTDCEKFPLASGCQELDDVPDPTMQTKDLGDMVTPQSGWGADNASCPSPITLRSGLVISYTNACNTAALFRPFLISTAWLCAAMLLATALRA